jgi:hypothetical protein
MAWKELLNLVPGDAAEKHKRYIRVNPDIECTPPLPEAMLELRDLQQATKRALRRTNAKLEIERVARTLVASSFYFMSTSKPKLDVGDIYLCKGRTLTWLNPTHH